MMVHKLHTVVLSLALVALGSSCASTDLHRRTAFDDAWQEQQQGRLERAILRYQSYLRQAPKGPQVEEAQFRIGECYALSGQIPFAERELQSYRLRYPEGRFALQAGGYLEQIYSEMEQTQLPSEMRPLKEREQALTQLEEQVKQQPEDPTSRVRLADAYLDVGELVLAEKALAVAEKQVSTYAESKEFRRVRDRLEQLRLRRPVHATDLYGNPGPLRVVDARGELRGDLASTDVRRRVEYVVTGYVNNDSGTSFRNVAVQVNLYQFGERLLAAKTVQVGTVPARGRRAFSANIRLSVPADDQVWRFECRLID